MTLKNDWLPGQTGLTDAVNEAATTVNAHDELITSGRLSEPELSAALGPDGTAGNISKQTAQGVALVQALIFGGN